MTAPMQTALPYGVRDIKLTPYIDALGTVLGTSSVDLPYAQTLSFSEAEETTELRGDDKLVTIHGQGAQVDLSLESGGISLAAWKILTGGSLVEEGVAPNRRIRLRKRSSDVRPYFRVEGQSISDAGGDVHVTIFRCRLNGDLAGDFTDGEFFVSNASGQGLPLLDDTNDLLYDFVQNEQKSAISLTPTPNPLPTPQNVAAGEVTAATVALNWDDVVGATEYKVQQSVSPYSAWTDVSEANGGEPSASNTTVTSLTASTAYKFRVKAVLPAGTSDASVDTGVVTTAAS
ncbi:major tail protein [Gordonia phage Terapin]|uniref:Major tail protein n=5 Tax=Terapinvirus terapin TaxID=2734283 RepID=A0A345MB59_9CAUD|nr:major tail protein [Gordonia phage Terapin]AVP43296.1 major tail protein [Gordonia phage Djokovic]AXH67730.1 major tail protein [Gordonia phage Beyoncage]QOC56164.1 major tail protein [Gordonia phage Sienna]QOC56589.1 major tail protein [Gordonia phage BiteSize]QYW00822.1 major tail protein [Gordonia phage Madi]